MVIACFDQIMLPFFLSKKCIYLALVFPWSLMQNPSTVITTANMYYLSVKTENSIQNFSWLQETYLMILLLSKKKKNANLRCKNNIFSKMMPNNVHLNVH